MVQLCRLSSLQSPRECLTPFLLHLLHTLHGAAQLQPLLTSWQQRRKNASHYDGKPGDYSAQPGIAPSIWVSIKIPRVLCLAILARYSLHTHWRIIHFIFRIFCRFSTIFAHSIVHPLWLFNERFFRVTLSVLKGEAPLCVNVYSYTAKLWNSWIKCLLRCALADPILSLGAVATVMVGTSPCHPHRE